MIAFLVVIIFLILVTLPYGLCLLNRQNESLMKDFAIRLPLYLSAGSACLLILSMVVGYVAMNPFTIAAIALGGWVWLLLRQRHNLDAIRNLKSATFKTIDRRILFLYLPFVFSFAFLTIASSLMVWPPPGDAFTHSLYVGLINYSGRVPTTFAPLSNSTILYTLGFHAFASLVSQVAGLCPGQAVLVLAAFFAAQLIPLLFSLTYSKTNSVTLSLIVCLLALLVPGASYANFTFHFYLFGKFWNGVYPALAADSLLMALVFLIACWKKNPAPIGAFAALVLAMFIANSSYLFVALVLMLVFVATTFRRQWFVTKLRSYAPYLLVGLILVLICFALSFSQLAHYANLIKMWSPGHWRPLLDFTSELGIIAVIGALASLYVLFNGTDKGLARIYLTAFVLFLIPMLSVTVYENFLFFYSIKNTYTILPWLSTVILSISASHIHGFPFIKSPRLALPSFLRNRRLWELRSYILLAICAASVSPYLFSHAMAPQYHWNAVSSDDLACNEWIVINVPARSRVLNDRSFAGLRMTLYGFRNLTNSRGEDPSLVPIALEINQILDKPSNYTLTRKLIDEYNIEYVFISSDNTYFDYYVTLSYHKRSYEQSRYLRMFDRNPWLRRAFSQNKSVVYQTYLVEAG
jgi:hypothetical protein